MFDWTGYLTVAEDLYAGRGTTASEEARLRAAVSRAYYAAFCPARDLLIDEGEISPARRDEPRLHVEVATRFKSKSDGRRAKIGKWLFRMREHRNACDYEAEVPSLPEVARVTLQEARWTLEHIAKLRGVA